MGKIFIPHRRRRLTTLLSRRDRNPYPRRIPPLHTKEISRCSSCSPFPPKPFQLPQDFPRTLFFFLLWCGLLSSSTTSGRRTTSGRCSSTARANVQQQVLNILALERLGEKRGPNRLDISAAGGLEKSLELVGLYNFVSPNQLSSTSQTILKTPLSGFLKIRKKQQNDAR